MTKKNHYEGVKHVVYISTNIGTGCEHCKEPIGTDQLAQSINHYIKKHGYKLLHVGTETGHADSGLWHSTVAVLGK